MGRLEATHPMEHMMLVLKRSPEQDAALERFLAAQQDPNSGDYQRWLTPEDFAERFGPSADEIQAVSSWLRGHGMVIHDLPAGRQHIEFSGVADQVETAFRTEMRRFEVDGERHVANATSITIPEQLSGIVDGVSLSSFRAKPLHTIVQPAYNNGQGTHWLGPYDFATIYNVTPLWNGGTDGTGQSIAIVGRAVVSQSDYSAFRSYFGLPASTLQVITTNYNASSQYGNDLSEAVLDVEWSGAVAKGATVILVASTGSQTTDGVQLAVSYAVNNNVAPIMSISFGLCEYWNGSNNAFYSNIFKQAAAQGISVFVSTGDSGSAGCDGGSSSAAQGGLAVSGLASTPYNVAVGGTQFNEGAGSYWNATNDAHQASAKSYMPEVVWNQSSSGGLWAGSGGVSTLYATPAWQTGTGVPTGDPGNTSQHHRYIPDVSLTAANHVGYLIWQGGLNSMAGTSASTPAFAGIMALINQRSGARNGLPNPRLYAMASQMPSAFHDITGGTTAVPCASGSANCSGGVLTGYAATTGYDLATGWGSVDANVLVSNWTNTNPLPGILSLLPTTIAPSGTSQTLTITGTGFQPGSNLQVVASYAGGTPVTYSGSAITSASTTQIQVTVNLGTTPRTWNIQVVNGGSQSSNTTTVVVNTPAPVITSVNPGTVTGSTSNQTFTINGTGFQSGAGLIVIVGYQGNWVQYTGSQITSVTSTQIVLPINFGLTGRAWACGVINPGGGTLNTSNSFSFTVNAPVTPAVTSVNPSTVTGSTSNQTFTINGTGFQSGAGLVVIVGYQGNWVQYTGSQITSVTATQIVLPINFGLTARPWACGVINPSGATSNSFSFTVNAPVMPAVTSLNPASVTGSTSSQTFAINGTGFQSGAGLIVIVGYQGNWVQYTGSQVTSVTSTQIVLPITFGTTARQWACGVINPSGATSNSFSFLVTGPPPVVSSVNPSTVTGSNSNQTLTINGSNFQPGTGLIAVVGTGSTWTQYTGSQIASATSTQIVVQVKFGLVGGQWAAGVFNPDGGKSNSFAFQVNAPVTPVITSINPATVTGSTSNQTFTINGTGFVSGAGLIVIVGYQGNWVQYTGSQITSVSATQIVLPIDFGLTTRAWACGVINASGATSNSFSFQVNAPVTPAITSINPATVTGSASNQTFTINGTGFVSGAGLIVIVGYQGNWVQYTGSQITSVSATQIVLPINFGVITRAWACGVVNASGATSNSFSFQVNAPPPLVTSVNPSTVTGSTSNQTFTINGTGFQSGTGLIVIVGYQGNWVQYTGSQITSVTPTQIVLPINFGLTARPWACGVINPGGGTQNTSNSFSFTVNAPVTPAVTSINPNTVTGSASTQTFTINGTGFQQGAGLVVIVGYQGNWVQYTGSQITSVSATKIVLSINFGTTARTWACGVINPSGATSNSFSFQVNAP